MAANRDCRLTARPTPISSRPAKSGTIRLHCAAHPDGADDLCEDQHGHGAPLDGVGGRGGSDGCGVGEVSGLRHGSPCLRDAGWRRQAVS
ncbi:hypothetical protein AB0L05_04375 [Nonomuraea pusilla]|uniref:hypothetical protein n=1 Tax=Nonomuraea pusilla TaxID=46177 RepID=UPI00332AA64C